MQDAYIPKDATNGKQGHRGFGFVTFSSADDVDKVLQCAHTIRDVDVAVQCAVPKVRQFGSTDFHILSHVSFLMPNLICYGIGQFQFQPMITVLSRLNIISV